MPLEIPCNINEQILGYDSMHHALAFACSLCILHFELKFECIALVLDLICTAAIYCLLFVCK